MAVETHPPRSDTHFCTVHPDRETSLRCNKCERYMCVQCAVQTSVGYRCKDCVRGIQDKYFSASSADYVIVFTVCLVLGGIGAYVASRIGFWLIIIFLGAPVGGAIAEIALRFTGRRRGRYSAQAGLAGLVLGALVPALIFWLQSGIFPLDITLLLFAGIAGAALYARFKMRG